MILLSKESCEILMECLLKHDVMLYHRLKNTKAIPYELGEPLREIICDELINAGLDAKDEPTPYGLSLEKLIDELGSYMYDKDGGEF